MKTLPKWRPRLGVAFDDGFARSRHLLDTEPLGSRHGNQRSASKEGQRQIPKHSTGDWHGVNRVQSAPMGA
jgi:hypothetical protein